MCGSAVGRSGRSAPPTSRRSDNHSVAPTSTAIDRTSGTSGARSVPVSARIRSTQPNGVSHDNQRPFDPESATTRTTYAAPNATPAIVDAARRVGAICEASAPSAKNTAGPSVSVSANHRPLETEK